MSAYVKDNALNEYKILINKIKINNMDKTVRLCRKLENLKKHTRFYNVQNYFNFFHEP